ncbi:MAG: hypothetical protein PHV97_06250 [Candidatus Omnitrophica bacterium]|nr:hypothetical protein [Candidatus Omnitrophota bacterium]
MRIETYSVIQSSWNWLREFKEYKQDYALWKQQVREGKCLAYRIILGRGSKTRTFSPKPPWKESKGKSFFRKISFENKAMPFSIKASMEIRRSLTRKITAARFLEQEKWAKKWGFYPLADPASTSLADAFQSFVERELAEGAFGECVKYQQPSYPDILRGFLGWGKLPPIPNGITLWIDYRQSKKLIQKRIGEVIDAIRTAYKIKETRPRTDAMASPALQITASFLKKIGYSKIQAKKHLQVSYPNRGTNDKETFRRKLDRVLDAIF